jgi:hypothetical protein
LRKRKGVKSKLVSSGAKFGVKLKIAASFGNKPFVVFGIINSINYQEALSLDN